MCGFVALFSHKAIDRHVLAAMRDRIVYRGPDDQGLWLGETGQCHVGFGFRRLSIQDLSPLGAQPMAAADGQVHIVFNGEIYNFIELRQELAALGHVFRSTSDTEVLLAAYLEWGDSFLERLNGQFAFAIWDARLGRALIARDRFGEKPLYYMELPEGGFAFASEIKAFFAHPSLEPAADFDELNQHGRGIFDYSSERTCFQGVRRFQAAHAMTLDAAGKIRSYQRYWTPTTTSRGSSRRVADLVAEFRERLNRSVSMRLRSDVTVGACLSGGLDSSSLVAIMAKEGSDHRDQLLHTISARFPEDPTLDEGFYIDQVLRNTGVHGKNAAVSARDLMASSRAFNWHQEVPCASASGYLEWAVHREARRDGLTVMIDGQGADELLGGYSYYFAIRQNDWMNTGQWGQLAWNTWLQARRLKRESAKYNLPRRRFLTTAGRPLRFYLETAWRNHFRRKKGIPLLEQPLQEPQDGVPSPAGGNYLNYFIANGLLYSSIPNQLEVSDRNGMASSVEARFPFLDYDFVDWCLALPEDVLVRDGWLKWILRKAIEPDLPRSVTWRVDKVGFQAPQDIWLRGPLKEWAHERIFDGPGHELEAFDRDAMKAIWDRHQAGEELSWSLWIWINISEWLDLLRDGSWKRGLVSTPAAIEPV